jgi:peptide/nickel transport system ATP-binding protein
MKDKKLLSVRNLTIHYATDDGVFKAVNDISFDLEKGETLGIVGETGAGKTTTALGIMRLVPNPPGKIIGGEIYYNGENLMDKSEKEMRQYRGKEIAMIFQDPMTSLNPVITVGEQIAEVIRLHDKCSRVEAEKKAAQMLETVGISATRMNEYPHQFSGGMKQRVVIAMALACNPQLIIADEPTTALDVTIQAQVLALMAELKEKLNTSMIMITHDLGIVAQTCDKVAIMYAGEIVEMGTVQDIFEGDKHHPYTIGLFGSIPDLEVETRRLNSIDGLMPDPTNLPKGCKFHTRCKTCMKICETESPEPHSFGGHVMACHLYTKEV